MFIMYQKNNRDKAAANIGLALCLTWSSQLSRKFKLLLPENILNLTGRHSAKP